MPPPGLFAEPWPGKWRRLGQLLFALAEAVRSGGRILAVHGSTAAVARGAVRVSHRLTISMLREGVYVVAGGTRSGLLKQLRLDRLSAPEFFLAGADVLIAFGFCGSLPVVVHVSGCHDLLRRYEEGLQRARCHLEPHGMDRLVPAVVGSDRRGLTWFLTQSRLAGHVVDPRNLSLVALRRHFDAAMRPLLALHRASRPSPRGADSEMLASAFNTILAHEGLAPYVVGPLALLRAWPGRWSHPAVFSHGDYWFANLLFENQENPVLAGVIDWERFRENAMAGADALYLIVQGYAHWCGRDEFEVLCLLWRDECEAPLAGLVFDLCSEFGLSADDLKHLAILIWLLHLRLRVSDYEEWRDKRTSQWLREPLRSIQRWRGHSLESTPLRVSPRD